MGTMGEAFVTAIAKRDQEGLRTLLADDVDFMGLTPSLLWRADNPDDVDKIVFDHWFDDMEVTAIPVLDHDDVAGINRVGYRFEVDTRLGARVVEQQAYYKVKEGRITFVRLVCSGFRVP
jgi:hypothetical protein